jgi:hypothetical protein
MIRSMKTMLLCCMVALASSAQGETILIPMTFYGGLHAGDHFATEAGIAAGAREVNPLMQDKGGRLAVKAAGTMVLVAADRHLSTQQKKGRKGAKAAKWGLRVAAGVAYGCVIANNIRAGQESRR